jgi:hypothetical protein
VALPPLTPEQRADALQRATAARRTRAAVRQELRSAGSRIPDVLDAIIERGGTDEAVGKMRVAALLEAVPGIGKIRAAALMQRLKISESRRVRGLGANQRAALADAFRAGVSEIPGGLAGQSQPDA